MLTLWCAQRRLRWSLLQSRLLRRRARTFRKFHKQSFNISRYDIRRNPLHVLAKRKSRRRHAVFHIARRRCEVCSVFKKIRRSHKWIRKYNERISVGICRCRKSFQNNRRKSRKSRFADSKSTYLHKRRSDSFGCYVRLHAGKNDPARYFGNGNARKNACHSRSYRCR